MAAQQKTRFSNLEFDLPQFLKRAEETEGRLVLRIDPALPGKGGTITLHAGLASTQTLDQELDRAWKLALGSRRGIEDAFDEEVQLPDGTPGRTRTVKLPNDGHLHVVVYAPAGGFNTLVSDAADELARELSITGVMVIAMSLRIAPIGAGAPRKPEPGQPQALPEPEPLGPDPYDAIDWGSLRPLTRAIGDARSIDLNEELQEFLVENQPLLGGVRRAPLAADAARTRVAAMVQLEQNSEAVRLLRTDPNLQTADALQDCAAAALLHGKPAHALLALFVAHERWPRDPRARLNLACLLAAQGAVNEAQALLDELRRAGRLPADAGPISSHAQLALAEAWCLMRFGEFEAAAAKLRPVAQAEPFFGDAALALALLEAKLGKDARRLFFLGAFRRGQGVMRQCGTTRDVGDPPPEEEDLVVELAAEEFIDLARGKPGKLPVVTLPSGIAPALSYARWFEAKQLEWSPELQALLEKQAQLERRWKESTPPGPIHDWLVALDDLLDPDKARLPELHALRAEVERAGNELEAVKDRTLLPLLDELQRILRRHQGDEKKACPEAQVAVRQAMDQLARPTAKLALAERRLFRLWHHYATAIGASVSDPTFRAYLRTYIELARKNYRFRHHLEVWNWAVLANHVEVCLKYEKLAGEGEEEEEDLPDCSEEQKKHSLGISLGVLSIEASCQGISVEAEAPLFAKFLTLSVEASFDYDGSTTVYAGPKVSGEIPLVGEISTSPSMKGGGYVKVRGGRIVDSGLRSEAKLTTKAGPFTHGYKGESSMSFTPSTHYATAGGGGYTLSHYR